MEDFGSGRPLRHRRALGDHAHLGHLQRLELDFECSNPLAKAGILAEHSIAGRDACGELLGPPHAHFGNAHAGDAAALVPEQVLGVVPALVFFADAVGDRDSDVLEEHLIGLVVAVDGDDRPDRDARRFHVHEQVGDSRLLLGVRVGAHQQEAPVGVMGGGGPELLPVDDVVIALEARLRAQRGEIGTRAGLRKALAEPIVETRDTRQKMAFLRFRAEGDQHRTDHVDIEGQRLRRRRHVQLFLEDVLLHGAPAGAAPFRRPCRRCPAAREQNPRPAHELFARQALAEHAFARQCRAAVPCGRNVALLRERRFPRR